MFKEVSYIESNYVPLKYDSISINRIALCVKRRYEMSNLQKLTGQNAVKVSAALISEFHQFSSSQILLLKRNYSYFSYLCIDSFWTLNNVEGSVCNLCLVLDCHLDTFTAAACKLYAGLICSGIDKITFL